MRKGRELSYPDYSAKILEWYDGIYTSVFILLHPFFLVPGTRPSQYHHGTRVYSASEMSREDMMEMITGPVKIEPEDAINGFDHIVKSRAISVSWSTIMREAEFKTFSEINRALLTTIKALRAKYEDLEGAERLNEYCEQSNIFLPTEGQPQPILEKQIGEALLKIGVSEVMACDEFEEERKSFPVIPNCKKTDSLRVC
jgi:hypothetical protein